MPDIHKKNIMREGSKLKFLKDIGTQRSKNMRVLNLSTHDNKIQEYI